jgi:hypothetical protein
MTVRLPDGQIEQIQYTGAVPPVIVMAPPAMPAGFGLGNPFAVLERMTAAMDRQAEAMLREANALAARPMPNPGGSGVIPAMSGPGVCMRSVQITFSGHDQAPRVVSQTSGDCGPAHGEAAPAALPNAPAPALAPRIVEARADQPYERLVQPVDMLPR